MFLKLGWKGSCMSLVTFSSEFRCSLILYLMHMKILDNDNFFSVSFFFLCGTFFNLNSYGLLLWISACPDIYIFLLLMQKRAGMQISCLVWMMIEMFELCLNEHWALFHQRNLLRLYTFYSSSIIWWDIHSFVFYCTNPLKECCFEVSCHNLWFCLKQSTILQSPFHLR